MRERFEVGQRVSMEIFFDKGTVIEVDDDYRGEYATVRLDSGHDVFTGLDDVCIEGFDYDAAYDEAYG